MSSSDIALFPWGCLSCPFAVQVSIICPGTDLDPVSMYGLSQETVDRYVNMGFNPDLVVEKMRKLNIRTLTLDETEGERGARLLEELLEAS